MELEWMLPAKKMRLPIDSIAASSRYTGHGSSSLQLIPAHSMSSLVHWNGNRRGSPVLTKVDVAGKAGATGGCGFCVWPHKSPNTPDPARSNTTFMLHTILALLKSPTVRRKVQCGTRKYGPREKMIFLFGSRNVTGDSGVFIIKSPLRQRAHSPLSPKERPLSYLALKGYCSNIPSNNIVLR